MCDTVGVLDVARYILNKKGELLAIKLQKLVYYSQAWTLVWDEKPLFPERIEAWANGPVIPSLYSFHRGYFSVTPDMIPGDPNKLSNPQKENIKKIIEYYGNKESYWLSKLTHSEEPWISAREGLHPGERGNTVISLDSIANYYSSL